MEFKDYYAALGVTDKATPEEIKKAYRKLARKYHPDVSSESGAEAQFKDVNEAYEVLKDPEKRGEYDQLRAMGARGADGRFRPPPDWESAAHYSGGQGAGFSGESFSSGQFSDFFESIFGRQGTAHRSYQEGHQRHFSMRGDDVRVQLPLFLEEAYRGGDKTLEFTVPEVDEYGLVSHRKKRLKVKIPPGTTSEKPIRLRGQGAPGIGGGEAGDLFLEVQTAPHPVFSLKGRDLYRVLKITPWEAALGATVEVAALDGKVNLKVPQNSQTGQKMRVKGKGFPGGDMLVELRVVMPPSHSDKAREYYRQLAEEAAFNPRMEEER